MKFVLILTVLIASTSNAQTVLKFDKRFVQSEDRWVAFQMDKDSTYPFGFIYIDASAGLTLNYEGNFKISETGEFIPERLDSSSIKVRLEPNNVKVAFIPENKFKELQIEAIPEWLKYYKTDTASIERLFRWGFMYNGWNECEKALTYLERAKIVNPNFKGLRTEMAFSYNCLGQYEKAIPVLNDALEFNSTDAYTHKELIYAQIKSGQMDKAAASCKKALAVCKDTSYNAENCYNLLYNFYLKKDKVNFALWLDDTKKWTAQRSDLTRSIKSMEDELNK